LEHGEMRELGNTERVVHQYTNYLESMVSRQTALPEQI